MCVCVCVCATSRHALLHQHCHSIIEAAVGRHFFCIGRRMFGFQRTQAPLSLRSFLFFNLERTSVWTAADSTGVRVQAGVARTLPGRRSVCIESFACSFNDARAVLFNKQAPIVWNVRNALDVFGELQSKAESVKLCACWIVGYSGVTKSGLRKGCESAAGRSPGICLSLV